MLLAADDKVTIVKKLLRHYNLGTNDCVAYGDSTSDIPLFRWLPHTVAINASPQVRQLATAHYDGLDLREAYEIGRALISGRAAT
jgi:phosphoserine phosphatase